MVRRAITQRQRAVAARFESRSRLIKTESSEAEAILQPRMTATPAATAQPTTELQLGPRIRALRQARNITLRELAGRAGVTESFLSQVEREVTSPSIASVQRIARALDLSIAELFTEEAPHGRVVRRAERRRIVYPGLRAVDEFLTSGLDGRMQVILSTIEPGGGTGDEPYAHDSDEEVVIVLSGQLELWVADELHLLEEGDSVTYSSRLKHRNRNPIVLFCVTPPSF
jgi:transcriptional regulator with XRE-family HTH domain